MKVDVLDIKGNKVEELALEKSVFGCEVNEALIAQYIHVYRTNQRQGTVKTKTRGEVSGGGVKPWKQKGTGRARHGSTRSPIWVGGGASHGPQPKDWSLKISKKMRKATMQSVLSMRFNEGLIKALEAISITKPSTKYIKEIIETLDLTGKTLFVLAKGDKNILKSIANITSASVYEMDNLNAFELISAKNIVFEKEALVNLQKKYK